MLDTVLGTHASHTLNPYRDIHPGYQVIEVGDQYETHMLRLIYENNAQQEKTSEQLNLLNDMMTFVIDLKEKKQVNEVKMQHTVDALNEQFPDLGFQDFIETQASFTKEQWDHRIEMITRKEKMLFSTISPDMAKLEGLMSDKNKVHEILTKMIELLNQGTTYIIRKTGGG